MVYWTRRDGTGGSGQGGEGAGNDGTDRDDGAGGGRRRLVDLRRRLRRLLLQAQRLEARVGDVLGLLDGLVPALRQVVLRVSKVPDGTGAGGRSRSGDRTGNLTDRHRGRTRLRRRNWPRRHLGQRLAQSPTVPAIAAVATTGAAPIVIALPDMVLGSGPPGASFSWTCEASAFFPGVVVLPFDEPAPGTVTGMLVPSSLSLSSPVPRDSFSCPRRAVSTISLFSFSTSSYMSTRRSLISPVISRTGSRSSSPSSVSSPGVSISVCFGKESITLMNSSRLVVALSWRLWSRVNPSRSISSIALWISSNLRSFASTFCASLCFISRASSLAASPWPRVGLSAAIASAAMTTTTTTTTDAAARDILDNIDRRTDRLQNDRRGARNQRCAPPSPCSSQSRCGLRGEPDLAPRPRPPPRRRDRAAYI